MTTCTICFVYKKYAQVLDEIKHRCIDMLQAKQNSSHWCFIFELQLELELMKNMIYGTVFTVYLHRESGSWHTSHMWLQRKSSFAYIVCYISVSKTLFSVVSISVFRKLTLRDMYRSFKRVKKKRPAGESSRWKTSTSVPMPDVK